ncbi:FK506-binding protein 4 [Neolecta irregularis DAH-3]|uniref:FK506-binding protein n=1 Tax=Neolecta irregularis (strain DAH-3) TaxID=1198029 RepID=A0A1U7LJ14_NEOID|nr:FK506-binding protein 4 [Neolecta irregularis DAH-3]|eukprot:OLL22618.1 FK506-binding protein 4 [Neolecta irregularis DAH-3]
MTTPAYMFGLTVAPGEVVPAHDESGMPMSFRLTMAAISSEGDSKKPATLKVIRQMMKDIDSDDDEEENGKEKVDSSDDGVEVEDFVLCTLVPGSIYQQTLDITFPEDEAVAFANTGETPIYLTGNYLFPSNDDDDDSEGSNDDDYDLAPDDDELVDMCAEDLDDEADDLDGTSKIEEIVEVPEKKAEAKHIKKNKKRSADEAEDLDELMTTEAGAGKASEEPKKLSKKEKKKLKMNNGTAVPAGEPKNGVTDVQDTPDTAAAKKNVTFSKETKTAIEPKKHEGGVVTEDQKIGKGPQCKAGQKIGMRYIGKLQNGKVFDSNTKGKPFVFTLGKGEVIKGWDIGVAGMATGGERRIIVPAAMGYGKREVPGIPKNSTLIFDVKLVSMK